MNKLFKTMAITALVIGALTASACAKPASAEAGPTRADIDAGRAVYDRLRATIGSPEDRAMASQLMHTKMQNAIAACMDKHGWDYNPIAWTGSVDAVPGPPGDLTAWAPISDTFGVAASKKAVAAAEATDDPGQWATLTAAEQDAWAADMNAECAEAGTALTGDPYPESYYSVYEPFTSVLEDIQSSDGAQARLAQWADCMKDADIDVTAKRPGYDGDQLWPGFRYIVGSKYDTASFAVAEEFERYAATSDAACRAPLHEYVLGTGTAALTAFETTHAEELAKLTAEWTAMRTEADALLN